jgi:hypothetical protein
VESRPRRKQLLLNLLFNLYLRRAPDAHRHGKKRGATSTRLRCTSDWRPRHSLTHQSTEKTMSNEHDTAVHVRLALKTSPGTLSFLYDRCRNVAPAPNAHRRGLKRESSRRLATLAVALARVGHLRQRGRGTLWPRLFRRTRRRPRGGEGLAAHTGTPSPLFCRNRSLTR